jgi:hypothetical protein
MDFVPQPTKDFLRRLGADSIVGGEFEGPLCQLAQHVSKHQLSEDKRDAQKETIVSLDRQRFLVPLRAGLPPLLGTLTCTCPPEKPAWSVTQRPVVRASICVDIVRAYPCREAGSGLFRVTSFSMTSHNK